MNDKKQETPQAERWHLKREVQLSHIITTLAVAASVVVYVQKIETRLALIEQAQAEQRAKDIQQDERAAHAMREVYERLKHMDAKLDRLIERQMK